jgi:uracil-DNA glycosylase
MPTPFDPGYGEEPFASLVASYPGAIAYPADGFRLEWGPSSTAGARRHARVLVIGQDPAQHETIARRILVGEAGHRLQGFLFKLGMRPQLRDGQHLPLQRLRAARRRTRTLTRIATYRHKWLDAIFAHEPIEAVVSLGTLADRRG